MNAILVVHFCRPHPPPPALQPTRDRLLYRLLAFRPSVQDDCGSEGDLLVS